MRMNLMSYLNDLVGSGAVDVDDESDPAGVLFVGGVVQAFLGRVPPRVLVERHPLSAGGVH